MSPSPHTTRQHALQSSPRRFKIYFEDDAIRQRSQETIQKLLVTAMGDSDASVTRTNAALLAKKALKYRKVLDRVAGVDVTAASFDASSFLGAEWCHTPSLLAYCRRS